MQNDCKAHFHPPPHLAPKNKIWITYGGWRKTDLPSLSFRAGRTLPCRNKGAPNVHCLAALGTIFVRKMSHWTIIRTSSYRRHV